MKTVRRLLAASVVVSLLGSCATIGVDYGAVINGERDANELEQGIAAGAVLLLLSPLIVYAMWSKRPVESEGDTEEPEARLKALAKDESDCAHSADIVLSYRQLPTTKRQTNGSDELEWTKFGQTVMGVHRLCISEAVGQAFDAKVYLPYFKKTTAEIESTMHALEDRTLDGYRKDLGAAMAAWTRADEIRPLLAEDQRQAVESGVRGISGENEDGNTYDRARARTAAYAAMVETEATYRRTEAEKRAKDNLAQNADLLAKSASWEAKSPALAFTACSLITRAYTSEKWNTPEEIKDVDESHKRGRACVQRLAPALKAAARVPVVLDLEALAGTERPVVLEPVTKAVPPAVAWVKGEKATKLTVRPDKEPAVPPQVTKDITISHTWVTGTRRGDNPEYRQIQRKLQKIAECVRMLGDVRFGTSHSAGDQERIGCPSTYPKYAVAERENNAALKRAESELNSTQMIIDLDVTETVSRPAKETTQALSWGWALQIDFVDGRPRQTLTGKASGSRSSTKHPADPAVQLNARDDGPIPVDQLADQVRGEVLRQVSAAAKRAVDLEIAGMEARVAAAKTKEERAELLLRKQLMAFGAPPLEALQEIFGAGVVGKHWDDRDARGVIAGKH